jgi:hypothetical protein
MTRPSIQSFSRSSLRLLTLAALCSAAWSAPAFAKTEAESPELYFYPAGGWKLEKTEQTCTASSQFNNGFLMQFTGSEPQWVQALNINFRQDIFKSGQSYDVSLSVPGVKTQMFKGQAINAQTLGMSLKERKEFYKSLSKSSVLDVAIEQNKFRFYLTGFAGFSEAFERCLSGSTAENAISPPPPDVAVQNTQNPEGAKNPDDFKVNEAIAMEESVKRASGQLPEPTPDKPLTEISQANPEPVVNAVPVKDVQKIGDEVIDGAPEEAKAKAEAAAMEKAGIEPPAPAEEIEWKQVAAPPPDVTKEVVAEAEPAPILKDASAPEAEPPTAAISVEATLPEEPPAAAPAPTPAIIQGGAPGLVNKNAMSQERIAQMMAQQLGGEAAPTSVAAAAAEPVAAPTDLTSAEIAPAAAEDAQQDILILQEDEPAMPPAPVTEPLATPPVVSTAEAVPVPEPAPAAVPAEPAPEPVVTQMSSPDVKVNTETFKGDADFRNVGTPEEPAPSTVTNQVMLDKIGELEATVEKLKAENIALNNDVKATVQGSEQERLAIASDNWNLEQATMRFNESERQVKKLGQELQMERAKCEGEKKDLEASLFDPKITDQQQLARLADLEQQLAKAKDEIELQRMRYEEQIKVLQTAR